MPDNKFVDTSVLVYAFDTGDPVKHDIASRLINEMPKNGTKGVISIQVLLELYNALTGFMDRPLPPEEASTAVEKFFEANEWVKLHYGTLAARRAVATAAQSKTGVWDALIAETMKENGIYTIITENEKDFRKIPGIRVVNPFK